MKVLINISKQVDVAENAQQHWEEDIHQTLERFNKWITRIEVHVTDENSKAKGGSDDIRCLMEARPANHQPISIEVRAGSAGQAVREGIDTLERRLDTMLDKARTEQRKK